MDDRRNEMARLVVADLDNEFAEIGFDEIHSHGFEVVGQFDFLAGHRLAFDDALAAGFAGDSGDDAAGIGAVVGEMNGAAVFLDGGGELLEVIVEMI